MATGQQLTAESIFLGLKSSDAEDLGPLAPEVPLTVLANTKKLSPIKLALQEGDQGGLLGSRGRVRGVTRPAPDNEWPLDTAEETTTLMLRRIPPRCTQQRLMHVINKVGFQGRYDFLYLPTHARSCNNRGFAFCNLESPEAAKEFFRLCHGRYLPTMHSKEPLDIVPAEIQGYERNVIHHAIKFSDQQRGPAFFRNSTARPLIARQAALAEQPGPLRLWQTATTIAPRIFCQSCHKEGPLLRGGCPSCGQAFIDNFDCFTSL
eukprot:CAMPEP_0170574166 /NCGR_PEP_ID=MMETSP0224-20130122/3153_1 /TAXON_ID=285029 /ORGANISM="Togula jolla, Strain CCCM 725" /LENGTH=262 /DNA_ID=CAMNT_0010896801 /DNA_START=14 /DNA_END=802 /DNA_ORIENTATION=-